MAAPAKDSTPAKDNTPCKEQTPPYRQTNTSENITFPQLRNTQPIPNWAVIFQSVLFQHPYYHQIGVSFGGWIISFVGWDSGHSITI